MSRDFISSWVLLLYPRAPVEDQLSAGKPRKVAATLCSGSGMKAEKCCLVVVLSHSLTVFCLANPILTIPVQLSGHWNKRLRAAVECAIAVASNCACDARFPSAAGFHRTLPAALAFQGTDVDQFVPSSYRNTAHYHVKFLDCMWVQACGLSMAFWCFGLGCSI